MVVICLQTRKYPARTVANIDDSHDADRMHTVTDKMSEQDSYFRTDSLQDAVEADPVADNPIIPSAPLDELDFTDLRFKLDPNPDNFEFYYSKSGQNLGQSLLERVPDDYLPELHTVTEIIDSFGKDSGGFEIDGTFYRFQLMDAVGGEQWCNLRRFNKPPYIDDLGADPEAVKILKSWNRRNGGIILVTGTTNAGKTTTAVSLLSYYLKTSGGQAITIEDPPEIPLHGPHGQNGHCIQTKTDPIDWGKRIGQSLRMSPNYIFIGELRYPSAAAEALRAALTGRIVITTLHAGKIDEAISRFTSMAADSGSYTDDYARKELGKILIGIVTQQRSHFGVDMSIAWAATEPERQKFAQMIEERKETAIANLGWAKTYRAPRPHL